MKSKALLVNVVMLVVLANAGTIVAQTVADTAREWEAVRALAVSEKLSVRLKDGKKVEGTVRSVSDTLLVLNRGNVTNDLNRDAIAKVYRVVRRSIGRSIGKATAMGSAIGFGVGAGVGIVGGTYEDLETTALVGFLGGFGAAIGAGIGALVGTIYVKPARMLIYDAK